MEHEIIDHLDENGNIIGTIDKAIAHRDGLWHKSVHVWVINDNNEVLLQQRCANKKFYPNVWDCSFAGHVGARESTIESASREGEEEIGINIEIDKMEYLFTNKEMLTYEKIQSNEFVDIYILRQNIKLNDIVIQESEVGGVKYVTLDEFFQMAINDDHTLFPHPVEYKMLKEYFDKIIKVN